MNREASEEEKDLQRLNKWAPWKGKHKCIISVISVVDRESLTCVNLTDLNYSKTRTTGSYSVLPGPSPGHTTVSQNRQSHTSMGCRGRLRQRSPGQVKSGLRVVGINRGHRVSDMLEDGVYPSRSVEPGYARLTVGPSCVITAAHADSAPSPLSTDVQAEGQIGHSLVKVALLSFAVAVTL